MLWRIHHTAGNSLEAWVQVNQFCHILYSRKQRNQWILKGVWLQFIPLLTCCSCTPGYFFKCCICYGCIGLTLAVFNSRNLMALTWNSLCWVFIFLIECFLGFFRMTGGSRTVFERKAKEYLTKWFNAIRFKAWMQHELEEFVIKAPSKEYVVYRLAVWKLVVKRA